MMDLTNFFGDMLEPEKKSEQSQSEVASKRPTLHLKKNQENKENMEIQIASQEIEQPPIGITEPAESSPSPVLTMPTGIANSDDDRSGDLKASEPELPEVPAQAAQQIEKEKPAMMTMTIAEYEQLLDEQAALNAKVEQARQQTLASVITDMRARIVKFGLTGRDLGITASGDLAPDEQVFTQKKRTYGAAAPKYRDPVSGQTWSGRGRTPVWLRDVDRDQYLIQPELLVTASETAGKSCA